MYYRIISQKLIPKGTAKSARAFQFTIIITMTTLLWRHFKNQASFKTTTSSFAVVWADSYKWIRNAYLNEWELKWKGWNNKPPGVRRVKLCTWLLYLNIRNNKHAGLFKQMPIETCQPCVSRERRRYIIVHIACFESDGHNCQTCDSR